MAAYKTLRVKIIGVSPLLLHNGRLADPMDEWTKKLKAVTGKRKKTDADLEEAAKIEWYGSLYTFGGKIVIPGEVLEAAIVNGAKRQKNGLQAKAGILVEGNFELSNGGADLSDLEALWEKPEYRLRTAVRVQKNKVYRTRPKFDVWSIECVVIQYDPEQMNEAAVLQALRDAQAIGDWRPKFGRFKVEKLAA